MYLPDLLTYLPTHHDLSSTAHAHIHRCICSCLHTSLRIYVHAEYDLAWFSGSLASSDSISGPGGTCAASGSEQWRPSNYGGILADMSLSLREFWWILAVPTAVLYRCDLKSNSSLEWSLHLLDSRSNLQRTYVTEQFILFHYCNVVELLQSVVSCSWCLQRNPYPGHVSEALSASRSSWRR